jgi:DNA modification methylase
MFDWQQSVVRWALRRGRACIFADCGLGKTIMQLEWSRIVAEHTGLPVLVLSPLAVAEQTLDESVKFGVGGVRVVADGDEVEDGVNVTNYEKLHRFYGVEFGGVVLDESSILKNYTGKIRTAIIDRFVGLKYKLACTATPSPNDFMELGNHSQFMDALSRSEMLSTFFVHDGGSTQDWRIKGHAVDDFWAWVSSWAIMMRTPDDLGFDGCDYVLPDLSWVDHVVDGQSAPTGMLFALDASTMTERRQARKETIEQRCELAAEMVSESDEPWVVWCGLNAESTLLAQMIPDAVEVTGSMKNEEKARRLLGFSRGLHRVIVTKPKIAGFGMNWQHCSNIVFVGLSDSYEQLYQSVRRCWRFGQDREVTAHVITARTEGAVVNNIRRKQDNADEMYQQMVQHNSMSIESMHIGARAVYDETTTIGDGWKMYLGDCVQVLGKIDDDSIDYSIFSPPFASLYTYSALSEDMGNCRDADEFADHFRHLVPELLRVTRPGRNLSFHCMLLPTSKARDGFIGLRDFRGELIRAFVDAGWIHHSEVVIWKDPVTAMQRTKALGLLYKQLRKNSCMSRQGIPDYLITMRKPGESTYVSHTHESFPVAEWQQYASPVWSDIDASDTLQRRSAREHEDERHICPLQLGVIRRALRLWTMPGDLVMSPFAGIGSEGYVSVQEDRRFVGVELKRSYYDQAVGNLKAAETTQLKLFGGAV